MQTNKNNELSVEFSRIIAELGFQKKKSFYSFLTKGGVVECSYEHLSIVLSGKTLPSTKLLNDIATVLPCELGQALINKFCQIVFPGWEIKMPVRKVKESFKTKALQEHRKASKENYEMLDSELLALSESKDAYYLLLLLALHGTWIKIDTIKEFFSTSQLSQKVALLTKLKLIQKKGDNLRATHPHLVIPEQSQKALKAAASKILKWNKEAALYFELRQERKRTIVRNLPSFMVPIVNAQIDAIIETLRASSEKSNLKELSVASFDISFYFGGVV